VQTKVVAFDVTLYFKKLKKLNIAKFYRKNQQIRALELRVMDEQNQTLGVMPLYEALKIAQSKDLDLVEISPMANPPVAKITDYGKFLYEISKREKENQKHSKQSEVKIIRIGFSSSPHDMETRVRQAEKFLKEGHKVKIDLMLHGRENAHQDIARKKFDDLLSMFILKTKVEQGLIKQGRILSMVISATK